MRDRKSENLFRSIAAAIATAPMSARAQGTPQPPPVRMMTGLPPHTGLFLGLLICALLAGVAWVVLCRKGPPPPPCAG